MLSASQQCHSCLNTMQKVASIISQPDHSDSRVSRSQINDELDRFILFVGNIDALHEPESPLSIESRLKGAQDVLTHILSLLTNLDEAINDLLEITSGKREDSTSTSNEAREEPNEETDEANELREEIRETITRLFRVSTLIRQASPTDIFAKVLSRDRYQLNDQFDIAHVGAKFPALDTEDKTWLRQRLGRAITQRRHYLRFIQDQHHKLKEVFAHRESHRDTHTIVTEQLTGLQLTQDTESHVPFFAEATTANADQITRRLLDTENSDTEEDAPSYTKMFPWFGDHHESFVEAHIPKFDDLRIGNQEKIECPFCVRMISFKNELSWRKHVFSDLRSYVCTFPDCDAPYFQDIDEWFRHEMTFHRVAYKCFLCSETAFSQEQDYLYHLSQKHPNILEDDEDQIGRNLARIPLDRIPESDCLCSSHWAYDSEQRERRMNGTTAHDILTVAPAYFKRHLATHLEQLALFAVPFGPLHCGPSGSKAATDEDKSSHSGSTSLAFEPFPAQDGQIPSYEDESQLALFTFEKREGTHSWAEVEAEKQHRTIHDLKNMVESFRSCGKSVEYELSQITSSDIRLSIGELLERQNQELLILNMTMRWSIAAINIVWEETSIQPRLLTRVLVLLQKNLRSETEYSHTGYLETGYSIFSGNSRMSCASDSSLEDSNDTDDQISGWAGTEESGHCDF